MNTRTRILQTAEQLFAERGYHATTLREVAERVGTTKPALYYHFESKSEILASLLDPMTTELEKVLTNAVAVSEDTGAMRRVLLTGWLDVFLGSRGALLALFRDLASMPPALYQRLLEVLERAVEAGAGPHATTADRITMAQAISAITDPVALIPDIPTDVAREHLLAGAWRLIGEPAPTGSGSNGDPAQPATAGRSPNDHPAQPARTGADHTPSTQPAQPASAAADHTFSNHPAPAGRSHTPTNHPTPAGRDHTPTNHPTPADRDHTPTNHPTPADRDHTPTNHPTPANRGHTSSNHPTAAGRGHTISNPPARGRGGRPKALSPADADRVRELHASGNHTADSIAAQLGVSRATVYRYLKNPVLRQL